MNLLICKKIELPLNINNHGGIELLQSISSNLSELENI